MISPLLSIVIPTYGRPQFLPTAIDSALQSSPDSVEVIIVPNGHDESWKLSLAHFSKDPRVRVSPIRTSHANAARNHGMSLALGKYLRFLDDDDFLYPQAAANQCQILESLGAEISSGGLDLCTDNEFIFKSLSQPNTTDFIESVLSNNRLTAISSHLYLRKSLAGNVWDESIGLGQDTHWIHNLCRKREWDWDRSDVIIGAWRHHHGPRISSSARTARHYKVSGEYLMQTIDCLIDSNRLTPKRARAAADGLWFSIHGAFFLDPIYWWGFAKKTQQLFPEGRPDIGLYRHHLGRSIPPLFIESVMLPKRWLNHGIRRWKVRHGKLPPW